MSCFDVKTIEFDSLVEYLQWSNKHYHLKDGVKVTGLKPINDDKYEAEYIELF